MSTPIGKGLPTDKYNPQDVKAPENAIKISTDPNAKTESVRGSSLHALPPSTQDLKTKDIDVKTHETNDFVQDLSSLVEKLSTSAKDPTVNELVSLKFLLEKMQSGQEEKLSSLNFWEVPNMFTELLGTSLLSKANKLYADGYEKLTDNEQKEVKQQLDALSQAEVEQLSLTKEETRQIEDVTFIGHFNAENRLEGEGKIIYPGAIHKGNFKNGLLDGVGEIVFKDYTVRGFFEEGDLKQTFALTQHEGDIQPEVETLRKASVQEKKEKDTSTYKTIDSMDMEK
jgi:hypothetical protein